MSAAPELAEPEPTELAVEVALRRAHRALGDAAYLITTANGQDVARVYGWLFDNAFQAVETLLVVRAGDRARTAARFGPAAR